MHIDKTLLGVLFVIMASLFIGIVMEIVGGIVAERAERKLHRSIRDRSMGGKSKVSEP